MALTPEEAKERIRHRDALLDIQAVLKTVSGYRLFTYLFREYDPLFLPDMLIEGAMLHEGLGQRRAFIEIFKLVSEADPANAAAILAQNIRERYNELLAEQQIEDEQQNT